MKIRKSDGKLSRRELLGHAARASLALPAAVAVGTLAACGEGSKPQAAGSAQKPAAVPTPEPAAPAAPKPATRAPEPAADSSEGRLVTEIPANATLISGLRYVNASPETGKRCGNCQLYTAGEAGKGKCVLFQNGLVAEAGWCQSWVQKIG